MANRLTNIENDVRENFIRVAGLVYERRPQSRAVKTIDSPATIRTGKRINNQSGSRPAGTSSGFIPANFVPKTGLIPFSFPRASAIRQASFDNQ